MEVSIIIRAYNEAEEIGRCLEAMLDQDFDFPFEIVVVYNTDTTDNTLEIVEALNVKVVKKGNYNPGGNINFGIRNSDGKYLVITSAHCFPVDRNWLRSLHKNFSDPKVAAVFGRHVLPDCAGPSIKREMAKVFGTERRVSYDNPFISNVNCMIRRDIWEEHPYDESPGNVVEDVCWAITVQKLGYCIVYEPEAAMVHYHNEKPARHYRRSRTEGYGMMYTGLVACPFRALLSGLARDIIADTIFFLRNPRHILRLPFVPILRALRNFGLYAGMRRFQRDGRKPLFEHSDKKLWRH